MSSIISELEIFPLMGENLNPNNAIKLNLSVKYDTLNEHCLNSKNLFEKGIQALQGNYKYAYGGYIEHRWFYQRGKQFTAQSNRTLHLGVDVWAKANTKIYSPLNAKVHSFKNNTEFSDYGPTIILELSETIAEAKYLLVGHLAESSLHDLFVGKQFKKGEAFAALGAYEENGAWPPHVHVQLIKNLEGKEGDYFGVCSPAEEAFYAENCPNAMAVL